MATPVDPDPDTTASPLLSVVVPIYNVGSYLRPCLDSLLAQRVVDLEIICVDDGSTDGSGHVADEYAERDPRIRVLHVDNGGLGKARNIGAELARGRYLAFVDSDDRVTVDGYEVMCTGLEASGSDFATGAVDKFTDTRRWRSPLHATAILRGARGTHISKTLALVNDTTAWNKVFRLSFWRAHDFRFPEGVLYEDIPVTIPAHVLAKRVDVTTRSVYEWRERGDGSMSITQRRDELPNLRDRLAAIESVTAFLAEHADAKVVHAHAVKVLTVDVPLYLRVLDLADETYRQYFGTHLSQFLLDVDPTVLAGLPIWNRVAYQLLLRARVDETADLVRVQNDTHSEFDVVRRGLSLYARLPYFGDRAVGVPDSVYEVTNDLPVRSAVETIELAGDNLVMTGFALIDKVPMSRPWSAWRHLSVKSGDRGQRSLTRPLRPVRRPDVTAERGRPGTGYDYSGFRTTLPLGKLSPGDGSPRTYGVKLKLVMRAARRGVPLPFTAGGNLVTELSDGTHVAVHGTDELRIAVTRGAPVLRAASVDETAGTLRCVVDLPEPVTAGDVMVWASSEQGSAPVSAALLAEGAGSRRGAAEFALADFGMLGPGRQRRYWRASAGRGESVDSSSERGVVAGDFVPFRHEAPELGHEFTVHSTPAGRLELLDQRTTVRLDRFEWDGGRLRLVLTMPRDLRAAGAEPVHVVLRHSGDELVLPSDTAWSGAELTAVFDLLDLPHAQSVRPGVWGLQVREGELSADRFLTIVVEPGAGSAAAEIGDGRLGAQVLVTDSRLRVRIRSGRESDAGEYNQDRLRRGPYLQATELPLRELTLFQSFGGGQYSGHPRAVYEELRRRGLERTCVWVRRDTATEVPHETRSVLFGSREYYEALATARRVITNDLMPPSYRKRDGSSLVQTWHGTPIKRIGYDAPAGSGARADLAAEAARWDRLVSPSPYASQILRRALRFDGDVLETGAPGNDIFHAPDVALHAEQVRARLNLSTGQRVLLWAPTWRDNQRDRRGRYTLPLPFDLSTWDDLLGPDDVLLFRGHHLVADTIGSRFAGLPAIRDMTRYPDIADLCLIADVLISDYSSVLVDFANTRRPMICYAWDLDVYREKVRGCYLDLETDLPAPLVRDVAGLRAALATAGSSVDPRYDAFVQRFCPLDDGRASERVVDALLADVRHDG